MIEIEKNVPLPVRQNSRKPRRYGRYPFDQMEVGDSFLVPYEGVEPFRLRSLILTAAAKKSKPVKVTTSTLESGVRVWRVA